MIKTCTNPDCPAPKGLCVELISPEYQQCKYWNITDEENVEKEIKSNTKVNVIPWSGLALHPEDIKLLSHRSKPLIVGTVGAPNAGKTSYLGMIYTLLFNGKKFDNWNFAGSHTLIAWENLAKYLKIKPNGKVDFPEPTPSNSDYYSLYHLALRNKETIYDVLYADSSGEVFNLWANDINDINAENARWIYSNSDAFIFFIDCVSVIEGRGRTKQAIVQLASQIASNLNDRPIVVVWSKADRIDEIRPNIKASIEQSIEQFLPHAYTIEISNFSKNDPDVLCHKNNLSVSEYLFDKLCQPKKMEMIPEIENTTDIFFKYRGTYGS
ncbi:hypothetical protein Q4512_06685 [Oceanihabitans sp. 2_MG-2023]|uniref:TRAFAC clade GTPase domain-containing protein n=1 Tax=Oceanihabitans sp. 2_MG-2023 TaxID=3062661 RepID=UPI0026E127E9|nr:hypothetical protein [Oceanihabitans sp. 2_MG-2023]MDO6596594.1 hypothetical protein [Oceanihabitans sp. 2_MG-2023]